MYKEVKGDLLQMAEEGHFTHIVHGCNCHNTMGAGIAAQIALRYPIAREADNSTEKGNTSKLGSYTGVNSGKGFKIVNAYTQYHPGPDFKLAFFETFLRSYLIDHPELKTSKVKMGFPQIGCGIGGGQWKDVKKVLRNWALINSIDVTVVIYESKKNNVRTDSGRMVSGFPGLQELPKVKYEDTEGNYKGTF